MTLLNLTLDKKQGNSNREVKVPIGGWNLSLVQASPYFLKATTFEI